MKKKNYDWEDLSCLNLNLWTKNIHVVTMYKFIIFKLRST